MNVRKSSYRSPASLQRDLSCCRACVEAGFPLESLPVRAPGAGQRAYLFGQAPGVAETIDWARTLDFLGAAELGPQAAEDTLGAVVKERDDLDLVREHLEEITSGG